MSVEVIARKGDKLTLQVQVDISGSMLEAEEKIQAACNEAGLVSTEIVLDHFDTDGTAINIGEKKIHSKDAGE